MHCRGAAAKGRRWAMWRDKVARAGMRHMRRMERNGMGRVEVTRHPVGHRGMAMGMLRMLQMRGMNGVV